VNVKYHTEICRALVILLNAATLASAVSGGYDWRWGQPLPQYDGTTGDLRLTNQNGARAADIFSDGEHWYARAIFEDDNDHSIWVLPLEDGEITSPPGEPVGPDPDASGDHACVLTTGLNGFVASLWHKTSGNAAWFCSADWPGLYEQNWDIQGAVSDGADTVLALGAGYTTGEMPAPYVYTCYRADPPGDEADDGVWFRKSYERGGYGWEEPEQISTDPADQIAISDRNPLTPIVAYHYKDNNNKHWVRVWKRWDGIGDWVEACSPIEDAAQPTITVDGSGGHVVIGIVKVPTGGDPTLGGRVYVCWWSDLGDFCGPAVVESYSSDPDLVYNAPTMAMVEPTYSSQNLVIVSELSRHGDGSHVWRWLSATSGLVSNNIINWQRYEHYMPWPVDVADENANPCVAACVPYEESPKACCFYTAAKGAHRALYRLDADYVPNSLPFPPIHFDGVGRRIWLDPDGDVSYAARAGANVHAGPVLEDNSLQPILVGGGGLPALALDGDGNRWVSYICDDTVWTMTGDGSYEVTFAGSSSAVPGQPSIVCYPNQVNGLYVGAVTFSCYDTAGGTSRIMFARACTSGVVLDTIESVQNLGDSLPCVSVFRSDTLVCIWQHGDSILGSMLCDYGPGTAGQVPAWSSPSLVSANGYHAMNRFDDNGTVLNVVWARNNGSNYAVQRATCDLASTTFGNWSQMATPGDTGSAVKANPVFGGLGVT
jgi:hypothetical protein